MFSFHDTNIISATWNICYKYTLIWQSRMCQEANDHQVIAAQPNHSLQAVQTLNVVKLIMNDRGVNIILE